MPSKTPKFDAALDEILKDLKPHTRKCKQCAGDFEIFKEDIEFYHKLRVPPPSECPTCRMQKRMAMMANILRFYKKKCEAHPDEFPFAQIDEISPHKIFDTNYWWNPDAWDAKEFGRMYNPDQSFMEQLDSLLKDAPHMAIARYNKQMVNSDYTADSMYCKNVYISSTIGLCEDVHYGVWAVYAKDSMDLLRVNQIENCYDAVDSAHCYNSQYIQNCENCIDSYFLFDCHNCQECFGCVNLRNKKYCFFNEQLSREEYKKRLSEINIGSRKTRDEYRKKFQEFIKQRAIYKAITMKRAPNSIGDQLNGCKNCFQVFNAESVKFILTFYKNANVRWSQDIVGANDCMDLTIFGPGELCYNVIEGAQANKAIASYFVSQSIELEYCFECSDCKYCFGCSGLKKKQYYILNQPYSESEYWKKVDEIKTKMLREGTYGEFLRLENSFFYYNDTYAQMSVPLDENSARTLGAKWRVGEPIMHSDLEKINGDQLPDDIADVKDDILKKAIVCSETGRLFQITQWELNFYRKHGIPAPDKHYQVRLFERFQRKNPYRLWKYPCSNCGQEMHTSYDPAKKLKVYCEACYLKEVV
ncbi:hypothetical protein A3I27_00200 [Candidatus Giovannonibacteria bacterium RIFCSPLOWO2_02_FULL_43_11b]|uniref:Zinc-binding domain-containing protein n=1 Tax=Candidatus Giovannonibacteria bacterium RIFCSPHIGHO2_12_FULL_43_15 TaxID=1798341 RepID=A0A1F5WQG9_9BACT|nr:MAG: hypothetical protein A2739_02215 [Candidatus Giovannonibacteria bacterium RIFCSPHIGHO2_01_FULL_43_100]OGF67001.1 MAG: hypothetical protein A3B97_00170 [Candidatus Giovannonibacteria bacterium RIFCSPHIGHO2_02_FULL_43_32]OGF77923.1 MAG: hypothetical protein A3F23_04295 [Candidatus Giovannonibacteria bacterium RIFCSPHIGHO2_12_FULL_43_15]OGF78698.1 MAG: hypothetical protein A3A15_01970 [Candidatus Giovannonibacteria bacterium RIFCSPLOWO2_01_FULL_43_60]OGF89403.1 MAG: hypothetical protein A3